MTKEEINDLVMEWLILDKKLNITYGLYNADKVKNITTKNMVKLLLEYGCNINFRDRSGRTALCFAMFDCYRPELVKSLIEFGADVNIKNNDGLTPMMYGMGNYEDIYEEYISHCEMLLKAGADINSKDNNGNTILDYAIDEEDNKLINWLKEHGAIEGETA